MIDPTSQWGISLSSIILKERKAPSAALDSIVNGHDFFGLLDCCKVCQIGQYQALYRVLGKEKFDKLFDHQTGSPLVLSDYKNTHNPLLSFLECMIPEQGTLGQRIVAVGQRIGLNNVNDYHQKHSLMGEAACFNVVCLQDKPGEQKYVGLGLHPDGMDELQIEELLVAEFNKPPLSCEPLSDSHVKKVLPDGRETNYAFCAMMQEPTEANQARLIKLLQKAGHPDAQAKAAMQGKLALAKPLRREEVADPAFGYSDDLVTDFNVPLIEALVRLPLAAVSMAFVRAFVERQRNAPPPPAAAPLQPVEQGLSP